MPENKELQNLAARDKKHESWLTLKAAYEEYQSSPRLSESMLAQQRSEDCVADSGSVFEAQQRAFERYIEARMDFLGCWVDQADKPSIDRGSPATMPVSQSDKKRRLGAVGAPFANGLPILQILPLLLLCVTAIPAILQQRHTRELQAALHDLQARIDRAREAVPPGRQATDAKPVPGLSAIREGKRATSPAATIRRRPAVATQIRQGKLSRTGQKKPVQATGIQKAQAGTRRERFGAPTYYPFTLSPSRQFKRLGPIRVTVSAIDPRRESVKLSFVSDFGRLDLQQLKPNQPVWIPLGNRQRPLEFVVDRIGWTSLEGHLG